MNLSIAFLKQRKQNMATISAITVKKPEFMASCDSANDQNRKLGESSSL